MLRPAARGLCVLLSAVNVAAFAQQQVRPPIAQYGVDVLTRSMTIPGMPAGMGGMGGMPGMGGMAGMPGMGGTPGGGGMGDMPAMGGPTKELWLGLRSSQKPSGPAEAAHAIPPAMNMGASLPLLSPPRVQGAATIGEPPPPDKPKLRMLLYWGCGETVRPGQPRVADTEKMSPVEFGKAFAGRSVPDRYGARSGQYLWPNERERRQVPPDASLVGAHRVSGAVTPEIPFSVGARNDWLAPLEVAARGALADPIALEWAAVERAQGYFLQAIAHRQGAGEMIVWTSSEVPETGFGLLGWLPEEAVRRFIGEKAILPPATTRCAIPKGVFAGADGGMLRSVAYGPELNLVHPPRPADPKVAWEQLWTVRVRVVSEGMTPLGMDEEGGGQPSRRPGRAAPRDDAPSAAVPPMSAPGAAREPGAPPSPADGVEDTVNKLKGLFRF